MEKGVAAVVACVLVGVVFADKWCGKGRFRCNDGMCISWEYRCDGEVDCLDISDEANCDRECETDEFQCRNGMCIEAKKKCDRRVDCDDASDEEQCGNCPHGQHQCDGSQCIEHWRRCDGKVDCTDFSDEAGCNLEEDIDLKVYPERQTIEEGRTVVFRCRDEGNIRSPVRWSRADNSPLPPDSTDVRGRLTMPSIRLHHSGTYLCKAVNGMSVSSIAQKEAFLTVEPRNDLPSVRMEPERQMVKEGHDAKIRCVTTGAPVHRITFTKVHGNLTQRHVVHGDTLVIRSVVRRDGGQYTCEAENRQGSARATSLLEVHDPHPPQEFKKREDVTALVGSIVQLKCPLTGVSPSSIEWTKDSEPLLPHKIRASRGNLWIGNVRKEDAGRYICVSRSGYGQPLRDYVILHVKDVPRLDVNIKASKGNVHMGDRLDLQCLLSGNTKAPVTWIKLPGEGDFPDNVHVRGPVLSINGVRQENGGVYRCSVDSPTGTAVDNYVLIIQGTPSVPPNDVETREAQYGSTVTLDCVTKVKLDGPVTYVWSKQNGNLSEEARPHHTRLTIRDVKSTDAGTYLCTAKSEHVFVEMPIVVVVTGLIPRFTQAPLSYMKLTSVPCTSAEFELEINFKPENSDGLLLYNSEHKQDGGSIEHISLGLTNGYVEFRYQARTDTGHVRSTQPVDMDVWHTAKIVKRSSYLALTVDYQPQATVAFNGKDTDFNWTKDIYVGSVPDLGQTSRTSGFAEGFVGCVSNIKLGTTEVDLRREAEMVGTTLCEGCAVNPCLHDGVCQELVTEDGYKCTCSPGFSGRHCEAVGETCYPGVCGQGRCVNRPGGGFDCYCPFGRTGYRCEKSIPSDNLEAA